MKYFRMIVASGLMAASVGMSVVPAAARTAMEAPAAETAKSAETDEFRTAHRSKRWHRHNGRRIHRRYRHVNSRRHRHRRIRICTVVPGFDRYGRLVPIHRCHFKHRRNRR